MGKIFRTTINDFSGGQSDDIRLPIANQGALIKHFNIFNSAKKLIPYRSTEVDINDGSTADGMKQYDVRDFQLGSNGKLYGHAKVVATGYTKVVSKADPTTGNWTLEATAEGNAVRIPGCFIEWQGAWWMFAGTTAISKWTIGSTFSNAVGTAGVTITTVAQGIVGADNNLYMFYNNRVVRVAPDGTVSDNVLTALPSDMRITSVARYGTYLAIGMAYGTSASAAPSGASKVFLWDMVTDTTVSDVIDWGDGSLMVLGNIEGRIVGVSDKYMSSTLGVGQGAMVIRMWSGGIPQIMKEVIATQNVTLGRFLNTAVVKDNKLYWVASVPFGNSSSTESTFKLGIWCYGRKNTNSNFALSLDYIEEAIDTANYKIVSFGNAGNFWFINHSADGSITKTDDTGLYSFTSIYESQKLGDGKKTKKLIGAGVTTEPLPLSGSVTLKYKSHSGIPTSKAPGTMTNNDGGANTGAWTDPNNAMTNSDDYATCEMNAMEDSDYLDATNFGFAIPASSEITGVKVAINRKTNIDAGGLIDSWPESNWSSDYGTTSVYQRYGHSFVSTQGGTLASINFYLSKQGSPTGNAVAKLYLATGAVGSRIPTGAAIAVSDNLDVSTLTTTPTITELIFTGANKVSLPDDGTAYIITIEYSSGGDINYIKVGTGLDSGQGSSGNMSSYHTTNGWAAITGRDLIFYLYTDYCAIYEEVVQLIKGGTAIGDNKNDDNTAWLTEDFIAEHGANNDLWGLTLTPADINASNFGVRLQAASSVSSATASVKYIEITVFYRSTWTTIFTETADQSLRHEAVNIESSGETLPTYNEIEFRMESTGGAEILEMSFVSEEIDDNKY
jgi:hypothetical protein